MKPTLLILRPLGLGDFLTAVPAMRALARAYPHHHRILVTSAPLVELADSLSVVNEVMVSHPLAPLPDSTHGADIAVNLHGSGPQSHKVLLDAQPKSLIAFANAEADHQGPHWDNNEHEVQRWCRLLTDSGIAADPSDLLLPTPASTETSPAAGATLLHPGAAYESRRWPVERWAAVAQSEIERGRRVVLTGGPDEVDLCAAVAHQAGLDEGVILAGRTALRDLCAAVASAATVVVGDTGVAHLATAYATPSVVLFGPMSPSLWGPPVDSERHIALWAGLSGDPHGAALDPGLDLITVEQVLSALGRLPVAETAKAVTA